MDLWANIGAFISGLLLLLYPASTSVSTLAPESNEVFVRPAASENTYFVSRVVDGDTLAIEKDGKTVTLRLIGLDTPETVDPRTPVQCFGHEASLKAKELLNGKRVRIEFDPSQGRLDKYGRTLAYVFLPDGRNFNKLMISEGYGYEYTYAVPYTYREEFRAAENHARENSVGLWSPTACVGMERSLEPPDTPRPVVIPTGGIYECKINTYDCASFKTRAEAQKAFDACGGATNDVHWLDGDKDGEVCEALP